MAYGVWFSMLNCGWQQARNVFSAAVCKCRQRIILSIPKISDKYNTQVFSAAVCKWRQRSILSTPKMSDKYNRQVKASIKAKGQVYCYLSVTRLLSEVVGPAHLETICSQKGIGQQEAMFYGLVYTVCNSTCR